MKSTGYEPIVNGIAGVITQDYERKSPRQHQPEGGEIAYVKKTTVF
jgi:hypothetical protein